MSRVLWCVVALVCVASARADDSLWDRFQTPPAEARPMVRWWWNGNAVTQSEIIRQIDQLHRAGIGGVEICPVSMPPGVVPSPPAKSLQWLGPEWCQMLKAASEAAAQRQMHVDLVAGCGEPWGGDFVKPEHAAQRVDLITRRVTGPAEFKLTREEFLKLPEGESAADEQPPELLFLKLVPVECNRIEDVVDQLPSFDEQGQLTTKVPKGDFLFCAGRLRKGFATVQQCADGAGGVVVDHYNREAVQAYLDLLSTSVRTHLGQDLGRFVQAMAGEEADLSGANWTGDIAAEFHRRCGYDIGPYLPFVVDFNQRLPVDKKFDSTVTRVRHDYAKTLADLYRERFVETFHKWAREHGTKSRLQMGKGPWLMGAADATLVPDVPQFSIPLGSPLATVYAASSGRVSDRQEISALVMANGDAVFQENLKQLKAVSDRGLLLGANRAVLHGFNYSPREAGFPGWVQAGTYFSPHSPWWPYLPQWSNYNARLSSLFQAGQPVAQIAILAPTADTWGRTGLSAQAVGQTPWYLPQLTQALSQQGCSADFVSQKTIQRAQCEKGKLRCGPMAYDALVVVEAQSLAPATTSALVLFAEGGGRIAFVGRKPDRAVGLNNFDQRDQAVVQAMQHLTENKKGKVVELASPTKPNELLAWAGKLITKLGVPRSMTFDRPSSKLQQVHYRHEQRDIFLFVNTSDKQSISRSATLAAQGQHAWHWNPETGERSVYPTQNRQAQIVLGPRESLLLVFEPTEPPANAARVAPPVAKWREFSPIAGPWDAQFIPVDGPRFSVLNLELGNLNQSPDERLKRFAGTVVYRTRFNLTALPSGRALIDLGKMHDLADVQLNGEPLGVVWYGLPRFDATRRLTAGNNTLEVRVVTPLFNSTRSLPENPSASYWLEKAARKEPLPAGMVGPVRLLIPAAESVTANQQEETADQR